MVAVARRTSAHTPSLHEKIIGEQDTPTWLVEGSLLENKWRVQLGDPDLEPSTVIDFNHPITPWPMMRSLTDLEFEHDLVTLKLLIIRALQPKPIGWITTSSTIHGHVASGYIDFVRWRVSRGIPDNRSLSSAWFNEYDASLRRGNREGLLNLVGTAKTVLDSIPQAELAALRDQRGDIPGNAFAPLLGLKTSSALTREARSFIEEYFGAKGMSFTRKSRERGREIEPKTLTSGASGSKFYRVWYELWRKRCPGSTFRAGA